MKANKAYNSEYHIVNNDILSNVNSLKLRTLGHHAVILFNFSQIQIVLVRTYK